MSLNFSRLIDPSFIFNPLLPAMSQRFANFLYIIFSLLIILSLTSRLLVKKSAQNKNLPQKKMWQKIANFLATGGAVGLILLLIRQSRAYLISMPFLFYLFIIIMLVWLIFITKWNFTKKKIMVKEMKEKMEKEKYL